METEREERRVPWAVGLEIAAEVLRQQALGGSEEAKGAYRELTGEEAAKRQASDYPVYRKLGRGDSE